MNVSIDNTTVAGASFVKTAGLLCLVGAVIGAIGGIVTDFIPPAVSSEWYSYPYSPTGFLIAQLVFILNHVLLLVDILGLSRSGAAGNGLLGRIGVWISHRSDCSHTVRGRRDDPIHIAVSWTRHRLSRHVIRYSLDSHWPRPITGRCGRGKGERVGRLAPIYSVDMRGRRLCYRESRTFSAPSSLPAWLSPLGC